MFSLLLNLQFNVLNITSYTWAHFLVALCILKCPYLFFSERRLFVQFWMSLIKRKTHTQLFDERELADAIARVLIARVILRHLQYRRLLSASRTLIVDWILEIHIHLSSSLRGWISLSDLWQLGIRCHCHLSMHIVMPFFRIYIYIILYLWIMYNTKIIWKLIAENR